MSSLVAFERLAQNPRLFSRGCRQIIPVGEGLTMRKVQGARWSQSQSGLSKQVNGEIFCRKNLSNRNNLTTPSSVLHLAKRSFSGRMVRYGRPYVRQARFRHRLIRQLGRSIETNKALLRQVNLLNNNLNRSNKEISGTPKGK